MRERILVDATMITAPQLTKNKKKERDSEMVPQRKKNQYYFGMKVHIGVDDKYTLVHTLKTTTAKAS